MSRALVAAALAFVLASWIAPDRAAACSPVAATPHTVDPALRGVDLQAPTLAPIVEFYRQRGRAPLPDEDVCLQRFGSLQLPVRATDDLTPVEQIGYRVSIAAGTPPDGLTLPGPILAGSRLSVQWYDGAIDAQEPFDMTLSVVAIDLAGNESAPQMVHVYDPGTSDSNSGLDACGSPPGTSPYQIDRGLTATDQTAPDLPQPMVAELTRGHAPPPGACGGGGVYLCSRVGSITIRNLATDNQTPAERIGYRMTVVEGRLPQWLILPAETLSVPIRDGRLSLRWDDGSVEDREPFDMTLQIVAVDQAGNESTPQMLRVSDPGTGGGCRIGARRGSNLGSITVALAAIAVAAYRRRRGSR